MVDSTRYKDWYAKAQADLESAKILFEHEGDYSIVAFHCQQAIEKALKGYILKHKGNLISGHSLIFLCKEASLAEQSASVNQYLKDCAFVNQFYIATRYPADIPTVLSKDEVKECISIAETMLNHIFA
ncbi:MAG: HEPN domain-containing protein [Leptospirales bacterium]|nr:HEPN domain-containing protein [Leptospirales bacterium]